jgi:hypothetical protein
MTPEELEAVKQRDRLKQECKSLIDKIGFRPGYLKLLGLVKTTLEQYASYKKK